MAGNQDSATNGIRIIRAAIEFFDAFQGVSPAGYRPRTKSKNIYRSRSQRETMASMLTCPCGWTIISPQGVQEVKKHTVIHLHDIHPGMKMTEEEIGKIIKTV